MDYWISRFYRERQRELFCKVVIELQACLEEHLKKEEDREKKEQYLNKIKELMIEHPYCFD